MNQQYRQHRYLSNFPLILKSQSAQQKVLAVDINRGGTRLAGVEGLNVGERVTLVALNEQVPGTVRWAAAGRVGIAFTMPARAGFIDIVRQAAKASTSTQRQGFNFRELR